MTQKLRYFCTLLLMAVVGVAWAGDVTDVLNRSWTGVTGTSYAEKTGLKGSASDAVYTVQCAGGNESIQLRSSNSTSGVVTTTSGGKVKSITVEWNSNTTNGRTLNVYGKNAAYSSASDLYNSSNQGTLLGTIVYGTSTSLTIDGDYEYIGFRSASGAMYLTSVNVVWDDGTSAGAPSITTEDVNIEYNATQGEIDYTLANAVDGGSMSASTTSDWLTLSGTSFNSPIAFSCEANETKNARTATVTLTYTYDNESVTKNVTVTQAGNPNIIDKIENISESGVFYVVKGTVVATSARGFVIGDGTGYVYTYLGTAPSYSVGDMVKISGTTGTYGNVIQFTSAATFEAATDSEYTPLTPAAMSEVPDYTSGLHKSDYYQFEGMLTKSGSNYVVAVGSGQIRISYPSADQTTELDALLNNTVKVKGFFAGNSNSTFTAIMESIEEVVSEDPAVTLANYNISVAAERSEAILTVQYQNIDNIEADIQFYDENGEEVDANYYEVWLTASLDDDNNVNYIAIENYGEERKAYFKVFALVGEDFVYSDMITITQAAYVAPSIATLPFEFNGGKAAIEETDGLTQEGLGSDYNAGSNPTTQLKFDGTGDWLLLQFDEEPGKLTFDIKGNGFSGGTFTVQTSEDGVTFTDLASYTELGATQNEEFKNLDANVRFIKWIYTNKSSGNVGLGNIKLEKPATSATITIKDGFKATTFSCDKALDFTGQNIAAYIITDENGATTQVTKVPANTGLYIERGDTDGTISYDIPLLTNEAEAVSDNWLIPTDGTEFKSDESTTYYVFGKQNGKEAFYKVPTSGYTPSANKAVLVVNAPASSAKEMIVIGGDVTGIESIENGTIVNDNYYTIDGKLVKGQPTQKGIYVVNGRKVVIK